MFQVQLIIVALCMQGTPSVQGTKPVPDQNAIDYAKCRKAVEEGHQVLLAIGMKDVPGTYANYHIDSLEGFEKGVYRCYNDTTAGKQVMQKQPPVMQLASDAQPVTGNAGPIVNLVNNVGMVLKGIAVNSVNGTTMRKAQQQAAAGRCYHPGGAFAPGAMAEGCGMSPVSAQHAIEIACLWNSGRPPVEISVVQGRNGYWHSCVNYR